jgi:hypothetical protein
MQRFLVTMAVVVAAISVSVMLFFGVAWTMVLLVETFEGNTGDCWSARCGRVGEFLTAHTGLVVGSIALAAALPPAALLWKARRVFAGSA